MFLFLLFYYILYIVFLFGIIPLDALFYIRPIGIIIIITLFLLISKYQKKIGKISLIILNVGFFLILKEFSRITYPTAFLFMIITTFILILFFLKDYKTKIYGIIILLFLLLLAIWQGNKIIYASNLKEPIIINKIESFLYGVDTENPTYSVDSSEYYNGNTKLANWYDQNYWNFTTELPLNGIVYYPEKNGKYPIVFIVHGNALAEKPSHNGYNYLLKYLAQNGFIAVSIDENFLNGNWTTLGEGQPSENDARGLLILEHIQLMKKLNQDPNSKLYNKIDIKNIGLIGHSRGGEAISIAAKYSIDPIKALMSLSGTDRQFREYIKLKDISYIALQGANDGDIKTFKARSQFNRIDFTTKDFNLKATYYLEGVNHVQFNKDWGTIDSSNLGKMFYGKNYIIDSKDQREIAKQLSLSFFNTILKNINNIDKLKNPLSIDTIPNIRIINDYMDSYTKEFNSNFTVVNGVKKPIYDKSDKYYSIDFKESCTVILNNNILNLKPESINFSMANPGINTININIKIKLKNKVIFKSLTKLQPGINKRVFKTDFLLNKNKVEPNFQFFEIPMLEINNWDSVELLIQNTYVTDSNVLFNNFSFTKNNYTNK